MYLKHYCYIKTKRKEQEDNAIGKKNFERILAIQSFLVKICTNN
jgi:hypothetical protein